MKRFTEQFNKASKQIKLTATERADLRDRLNTYMEYHPLPANMRSQKTTPTRSFTIARVTHAFSNTQVRSIFMRSAVPTMAVMMMVVVPILAEGATPGDVLYPVKVRFNEEIRSQLASSPYEAIEWESERIERRIAEARLLASEGKLTTELEAEVAEAIKEQTQKTKTKIAELKTSDADEGAIAEINLASALEVQTEMLEADVARNESAGVAAANVLASVVAEESSVATAEQEQANPSYDKLLARIEVETTNAHELFNSIKPDAQTEEITDIEERLAMISAKVNTAQQVATAPVETLEIAEVTPKATTTEEEVPEMAMGLMTISITTEAATTTDTDTEGGDIEVVDEENVKLEEVEEVSPTILLREALTDIRKLISFMTDIDVRTNVKIQDLVPVEEEATAEEETLEEDPQAGELEEVIAEEEGTDVDPVEEELSTSTPVVSLGE